MSQSNISVNSTLGPTIEVLGDGGIIINVANPVSGTGDVTSSSLSLDNQIALFEGTSGKIIQNSGITIADGATGTLSGTNSGDVTVTDTYTVNLTIAGQALSGEVNTQQSITSDANGIKLNGDSESPGNSFYYGTDGGGSKGFHALPVGTVTSVGVAGTDGIEVDSGSPVTGSGTITLGVNAATMKTTLNLAGTNTGDQNLFGTFAVAGQSNVVADSTNDTLTFVAGSNITITTNATTDAITINSTASGSGDVVGPLSATDNAIARYDQTTGKLIQNSGITIPDGASGTLSGTNTGDQINITGNAATVTTNANLTGPVTSIGNTTSIANGAISNAMLANGAVANLSGTNTGDQNLFGTIAVAGQSNVVADSTGDTLTLVAGSNITITTNASTDSITINSTASGSGDVVGPSSATDNALVRYDGTTGKLVQNGQVTQSDTGDLAAINSMTMDTTPTGSLATQGQMMWNSDEETLDIQLNGFALHVGEHVVYHVKNSTGSTIANGVPVMFAGTTGSSGKLLIQPWNGTGPATLFMGITGESLTTGSEGFVIAFGKVRGIQTNGANYGQTWVDGEIIYAGTTTGSLTKTQPSAPNPIVQVLAVVNAHASNGTYFIRPNYILGDAFGPASATDNALARFDGTTGKLIQNSVATVNDNGTISATQLFCTSGSGQDAIVSAAGSTSSVSITTWPETALRFVGETGADPPVSYDIRITPSGATQDSYDLVLPPEAGTAGQVLSINNASGGTLNLEWANAGTGDALTSQPLSQFASTTSTQLRGVMSDETGSGALVFAQGPTLIAPILGTPTSGNLSNCTNIPFVYPAAVSDETTALTAGVSKLTFRMPCAMTLTSVRASVGTAPTGSTIIVDINESGTSILSTKLSIDATEKTSTTAAVPAVISDSSLADDAEITIDIDQIGSTVAGAGLKIVLIGTRS